MSAAIRLVAAAATLVVVLFAVGCGAASAEHAGGEEPLLVLAAADLQAAMPDLVEHFQAATGTRVQVVLGSTGNLTAQIEHGAPGDVFLAANQSFIDRLAARDLIVPGTRRVYALGPLVLVSAPRLPLPRSLADLAEPAYGTIAIASPEHAPYGVAAREAMQAAGIWEAVRPRLVFAENVAQALQFVRTGNADAGLVARGLVVQLPDLAYQPVDASFHAPLRQTGAVLRASNRSGAAAAFLDMVLAEQGQEILRRHGFELPDTR